MPQRMFFLFCAVLTVGGKLENLSLKELRNFLNDRGASCNGCAEKGDWLAKAKEVENMPPLEVPPQSATEAKAAKHGDDMGDGTKPGKKSSSDADAKKSETEAKRKEEKKNAEEKRKTEKRKVEEKKKADKKGEEKKNSKPDEKKRSDDKNPDDKKKHEDKKGDSKKKPEDKKKESKKAEDKKKTEEKKKADERKKAESKGKKEDKKGGDSKKGKESGSGSGGVAKPFADVWSTQAAKICTELTADASPREQEVCLYFGSKVHKKFQDFQGLAANLIMGGLGGLGGMGGLGGLGGSPARSDIRSNSLKQPYKSAGVRLLKKAVRASMAAAKSRTTPQEAPEAPAEPAQRAEATPGAPGAPAVGSQATAETAQPRPQTPQTPQNETGTVEAVPSGLDPEKPKPPATLEEEVEKIVGEETMSWLFDTAMQNPRSMDFAGMDPQELAANLNLKRGRRGGAKVDQDDFELPVEEDRPKKKTFKPLVPYPKPPALPELSATPKEWAPAQGSTYQGWRPKLAPAAGPKRLALDLLDQDAPIHLDL